jgi:hypothetical protein
VAKTHEAYRTGLKNPKTKDKIQNDSQGHFYLLTPKYRVLLVKLIDIQPVKKYPAFYGN